MEKLRKYIYPILSIAFFMMAMIQENHTLNHDPEAKLIETFRKKLLSQESKLSVYMDNAAKQLMKSPKSENYVAEFVGLNQLYDQEGLGLIIFRDQKMVFWSDNHFAFSNLSNILLNKDRLLILPNGIYSIQRKTVGENELVGLVHIKNNYTYENQFLENKFAEPFELPSSYKIISTIDKNAHPIYDLNNAYLFSVLPPPAGSDLLNESQLYFPGLLYLAALLFLLITIYSESKRFRKINFVLEMLGAFLVLTAIYSIHLIFGIPLVLNHFSVFSPQYYAASDWLPTLGDFFLVVVLFFFWSLLFVRDFPHQNKISKSFVIPLYLFVLSLYQLIGFTIGDLIRNSNINYKLNQITDIDQFSLSSYLAIAVLLFSVFIIHLKIIERTCYFIRERLFLRFHLIATGIAIILCIFMPGPTTFILSLFFAVNLLQCQIRKMQISLYSISYSILFISLFSVISLLLIYQTIKKRDIEVQKLLAINLSSEQDPATEVFLGKMQVLFYNDSVIPTLLVPPYKQLENYLTRTYFSGYFRKYDIQYWFCSANDSVLVQPENVFEPCFPFFNEMIERSGIKVPGTNFNFMNNMNGRVSYLGKLDFRSSGFPKGISVYIEINSKIASEGIGFPELLLDKSLIKPLRYKHLSYGKYFEDELVNRSGEYTYNYYLKSYNIKNNGEEFQLLQWNGYDHLVYTFDENNHIIVSNKSLTFIDYVISFPYIFVFYFVFVLVIILIGNSRIRKLIVPKDLRFRIQISIISVVLISLLFVASGTIYYNIEQYRNRHQNDLLEKIKSISEEIKNRLLYVNTITPELKLWLYDELYKLSNTFRTDINIYDIKGELIATSRPEIFAKGVATERINSTAFYELSEHYQLNYFQPEKIGTLSYLSAYEPIINASGDYLGYLNLPYFTREDDLKQGISTFIVAFINLYLFLFLASVLVAVILSNKITKPLSLIREKLKGIQLGKKSEPINYEAKDEIGALVREYNHKVEELAESAELLARSERESAWREMAKQVAHEIKNPLTPMKLNIQYLQRAKEEGSELYDDFFDRVTKNLIEQIDTLSEIATEFSNFAQIPKAKNEVFNLIGVLQNVCSLFEPNQNLKISMELNGLSEIFISADKEQISRVFLNLTKNGIQSIPSDERGEIRINVKKEDGFAMIAFSDNGVGISQEAQQHLFEPNFTTKTSGMGLGLSIVRNIIQTAGGKIEYETSAGLGTTFYVHLPLSDKNT
jgi:two-component system nitrogen regulation sensor histidine kinase NtrY